MGLIIFISKLRNHIVKTYTAGRMLIDVFAYNNDLVREMRDLEYKSVHFSRMGP